MTAPVRHLYVHVPFCPSICPYCDFHVLTRQAGLVERYLKRLKEQAKELAAFAPSLDTVYLGGGTPSFLRDHELSELVSAVRPLGWGHENTLEVNPGTVSRERVRHWRELGFDRASLGVQSLHDPTLRFLGRQHSAAQARAAAEMLLESGFRVSADLMTAIAGQPLEADIRGLAELGVGHISAYTLTIESGTEFARRGVVVHEEDERRGFEQAAALLGELGFERYEISNYARAGQESRHNLSYWTLQHYLGLGPSAAGHYPPAQGSPARSRRWTQPHLHAWLEAEPPEIEELGPHDFFTDALFMGLRLRRGVSLSDLSQRSGLDALALYGGVIAKLEVQGLLERTGPQQDILRATPAGWWVLNDVIRAFLRRAEELQGESVR